MGLAEELLGEEPKVLATRVAVDDRGKIIENEMQEISRRHAQTAESKVQPIELKGCSK
jgi:hypothetical protein